MPYIYKITNLVNDKIYIGKTSLKNINERFEQHCNDAKKPHNEKRPLYNAINKYGNENFKIELVETVDTDLTASEREIFWIKYFNSYIGFKNSNGYNATLGGDGKAYINKEKIKKLLINKIAVQKIANMCDCCVDTVYAVAKENNIHLVTSQELTREKLKKEIKQIDLDTQKVINTFNSVQDACVYIKKEKSIQSKYNSMRAQISQCARGLKKQAFGYRWEYKDC